jgi:hypothetical protein
LHLPSAPALSTLGLAERDAALFTFGDKESFLLHVAQNPLLLYLFAEAFE